MKFILLCMVMVSVSLGQPSNNSTLSTCKCGRRNSGRIVGGKETGRNEYPWMVGLIYGPYMCGGSIITEYHVLTAAHCTFGLEPHQITILPGRHKITNSSEGEPHAVDSIIQHKDFIGGPSPNDIAILVTKEKISFNQNVSPVCLPNKKFDLVGKEMKITGWGMTQGTGDSTFLREIDLRFVPLETCRLFHPGLILQETQSCARGTLKDSCNGDSGGPLVYLNPDTKRYTQVALVSFGETSCTGIVPSINTDVFSFMDWINAAILESKKEVKACTGN